MYNARTVAFFVSPDREGVIMCSLFFDTHAFVLLKGKGDLGQKATPGETNQIRETRHVSMSILV